MSNKPALVLLIFIGCLSCKQKTPPVTEQQTATQLHQALHQLTGVIVHDVFTPPVASRIYAYSSLAFYEGVRFARPGAQSLVEKLNGFPPVPQPTQGKRYDYALAGLQSFYTVGTQLIFSKDTLRQRRQEVLQLYRERLDEEVFNNSIVLGDSIAKCIMRRASTDNYKQTRGMPRYSVFRENGRWQQTPPDYMDAVEPHWSRITPLLMDSSSQFRPLPPPGYDTIATSLYHEQLMEVFNITNNLSASQDTIARYWDDNAFVTEHEGHLMYATKKTTPGGHWMGITSILSKQKDLGVVDAAKAYALVSCSMLDGFIACWDEKYRSRTVRPITVINDRVSRGWKPVLQTPPFPEYPSGHSTISSAAATVLINFLGDDMAFMDTTEVEYLGLRRYFPSISQAAEEVGMSRLYGGIHFRAAIEQGAWQGRQVGELYTRKFLPAAVTGR